MLLCKAKTILLEVCFYYIIAHHSFTLYKSRTLIFLIDNLNLLNSDKVRLGIFRTQEKRALVGANCTMKLPSDLNCSLLNHLKNMQAVSFFRYRYLLMESARDAGCGQKTSNRPRRTFPSLSLRSYFLAGLLSPLPAPPPILFLSILFLCSSWC